MHRSVLAGLAAITLLTPSSYGWGRDGHALIGAIAARHLNAKARAEVSRLLERGETLISIASWADEIRPNRRETSTWHYINIPISQPQGDWKRFCPPTDCVIGVIPKMQETLRSATATRAQKAEALKYLVHFVGDMHQPLHTGDNRDRGGNGVAAVFQNKPTNLHAVWDYSVLEYAFQRDSKLKGRIARGPGFWTRREMRKGTPEEWLWQSHGYSRDTAYGSLTPERPAVLGASYADKTLPAMRLQIERAGVRLARLLNETIGR